MRQAVLDSEVVDFPSAIRPEVVRLLEAYVSKNRDSNDRRDLIAVGSAIRKMVSYAQGSELGCLAEILDSSGRVTVPIEIELEVAKTVVRKLTKHPELATRIGDELENRLWEITQTYVNPRLIGRPKYGATALNAFLALLLLRGKHAQEAIKWVKASSTTWFKDSARSRSKKLLEALRAQVASDTYETASKFVFEFVNQN
jgi:hypothetical protein